MNPTFSILHASYGRPKKALDTYSMWLDRCSNRSSVEYILACNSDDHTFPELRSTCSVVALCNMVVSDFKGSAPAWDAAAKASTGLVLIQAQDDVEPPEDWDEQLILALDGTENRVDVPAFIAVSDGYRKDNLCCTAIMNRARYEQCGEFLHPGYISVFSDDDATIRAYADASAGKCSLIEARDLVFLHRHHYHDKSVPMDATYERENSSKAYAHGQALFMKRNADLVAKGFKTW